MTTREMPELTEKEKSRFWSKVNISQPDNCWEWKGYINPRGYGTVTLRGRSTRAHRVSLFLTKGPFAPDKPHALHTCDNPKCCNPSHLFAGTHAENMADMTAKGRGCNPRGEAHGSRTKPESKPRGESHSQSRFTADQVLDIRQRITEKSSTRNELASEFGVSVSAITAIHLRQNWFHI